MEQDKYSQMELNQVAMCAHQGEVAAIEYIVNWFGGFIKKKAKSYFLLGAESEDLMQEGMIGLIKAIRDYSPDKNASFKTFAELCITRQIITAVKTATRKKHAPLNSYISLYHEINNGEGAERYLVDEIESLSTTDPVDDMIRHEELDDVSKTLHKLLSEFELQVLEGYMEGKSYQQMAKEMGKSTKSIDNALQRVKKKAAGFGTEL